MAQVETETYTVGVFQDVQWADRGLEALLTDRFPAESLSVLAREIPEVVSLIERRLSTAVTRLEVPGLGPMVAAGPLLRALDGRHDLGSVGLARSISRLGFQSHDGLIFDKLASRGGVLVAILGEARAADALQTLFAYGGGNAAIAAWNGRV